MKLYPWILVAQFALGYLYSAQADPVTKVLCEARLVTFSQDRRSSMCCIELKFSFPKDEQTRIGFAEPQKPGDTEEPQVGQLLRGDFVKIWRKNFPNALIGACPLPSKITVSGNSSLYIPLNQVPQDGEQICIAIKNVVSTLNTGAMDRNGVPELSLKDANEEGVLEIKVQWD